MWGLLGLLAVRYGNDLLLSLYDFLPDAVAFVVVWVLVAVASVDFAGSLMAAWHMQERLPRLFGWNRRLQKWTYRFAAAVTGRIEERIIRAYPATMQTAAERAEESEENVVSWNSSGCF